MPPPGGGKQGVGAVEGAADQPGLPVLVAVQRPLVAEEAGKHLLKHVLAVLDMAGAGQGQPPHHVPPALHLLPGSPLVCHLPHLSLGIPVLSALPHPCPQAGGALAPGIHNTMDRALWLHPFSPFFRKGLGCNPASLCLNGPSRPTHPPGQALYAAGIALLPQTMPQLRRTLSGISPAHVAHPPQLCLCVLVGAAVEPPGWQAQDSTVPSQRAL